MLMLAAGRAAFGSQLLLDDYRFVIGHGACATTLNLCKQWTARRE